ncbi:MAG TPA: hypothetical protein VGE52_18520 [Pirellulales bacterium]
MGLAVSVGMLADLNVHDPDGARWLREALTKVNSVLEENRLPTHSEPEALPALNNRAQVGSYPYSFLHHLRRFAVYALNPDWKPKAFPKSKNPANDPAVFDEMAMLSSHLLCHSDSEGFYVPIEFDDPLFADEGAIPGGMLGSSQRLLKELRDVAPKLGITLIDGTLSDAEADRINSVINAEGRFWIEQTAWLSLFEAARLSIDHRTAICFG